MKIKNTFHITYCTNIHPGADWRETFENIKKYVPVIKASVAPEQSFGLGLRLSNQASVELEENLEEFREWLDEYGIYVFTMNGFPYGTFHDARVKDNVHAPDWTTPERLEYTLRLFDQLAYLLPQNMDGGISTSPVSYAHWHTSPEDKSNALRKGALAMGKVALHLAQTERDTGKYLHLDIEPEPDGLLENTQDVLRFYREYLFPVAGPVLMEGLRVSENESKDLIRRYLTLCYDICHFSLAYEEPGMTFQALAGEGIQTGKIQVSAALKILPDREHPEAPWETLSRFDEPVYLHQVTELRNGKVYTYNDLPAVLSSKPDFSELRAHFHVPIFVERFESLFSTQDHILKTIDYLKKHTVSRHLEVETYTWDVLPEPLKEETGRSIIRELEWLKNKLA